MNIQPKLTAQIVENFIEKRKALGKYVELIATPLGHLTPDNVAYLIDKNILYWKDTEDIANPRLAIKDVRVYDDKGAVSESTWANFLRLLAARTQNLKLSDNQKIDYLRHGSYTVEEKFTADEVQALGVL